MSESLLALSMKLSGGGPRLMPRPVSRYEPPAGLRELTVEETIEHAPIQQSNSRAPAPPAAAPASPPAATQAVPQEAAVPVASVPVLAATRPPERAVAATVSVTPVPPPVVTTFRPPPATNQALRGPPWQSAAEPSPIGPAAAAGEPPPPRLIDDTTPRREIDAPSTRPMEHRIPSPGAVAAAAPREPASARQAIVAAGSPAPTRRPTPRRGTLVTPPPHDPAPRETIVEVHIGSIEVRVPAAPPAAVAVRQRAIPARLLADYLERRDRERA